MAATGTWVPTSTAANGPLAAWLTVPPGAGNGVGVVILPPVGYEHSTSYRAWRLLASTLSDAGCCCLRIDPYGTGDSPGHAGDVTSLGQWRVAVAAATTYLRESGCRDVVLVGCRVGGTLALLEAAAVAAAGVVAIAPVVAGRRYVKELRLLGIPLPDESGDIAVAGTTFTAQLLDELSKVDVAASDLPAVPTLVVTRSDTTAEAQLLARQPSGQIRPELMVEQSLRDFLDRPAEEAVVDDRFVAAVASWIDRTLLSGATATGEPLPASDVPSAPTVMPRTTMAWRGRAVSEEFVTVGPDQLAGVLTTKPPGSAPGGLLVVFLNSGSDPHTGPARAWVEFARDLAADGGSALRVDFRSWGESPDGPTAPGRPYDAHTFDDTRHLVEWLKAQGWSAVVLCGLCAGAWIALDVARNAPVDGVLALNPQMYWQPGDAIEALMSTTRLRRLPEIEAIKREAAAGRWDDEDRRGLRPPAAQWLDELAARRIPISLVFAEGDDGIEYLTDRLGRRLAAVQEAGTISVTEVSDIDHGMHRAWLRPAILAAFAAGLEWSHP